MDSKMAFKTSKSPFELKLHQTEQLPAEQMSYAIADLTHQQQSSKIGQ